MIQKNVDLPSIFDDFSNARQQGFLKMKSLKDQGRSVVGIFCTYTPVELFMAADLVYVSLCSTSDETIPAAEKVLPRNLCPLIKASYGFAITDKCPYMYFADLIVGETTCDGKKKMYELLGEVKNVHVMELPQSQTNSPSINLWRSEVLRLKEKLEKDFELEITEEKLQEAVTKRNLERAKLKEVYELSTQCPPPITGLEQLQILFGSQFQFNHEDKIASIDLALKKAKSPVSENRLQDLAGRKRILITGCPIGGVTEKIVKVIEESNGVVVAYENCTGAKQYDRQIPLDGNIYENIADYYLQIGCAVMTPDKNRLELLDRLCEQFKVDGVVEMVLQSCHPYAVESEIIKKHLKNKGIPFMAIETDYSISDVGQLKTRAEAFCEML
jgi:benzoyl-CoA reductase/2-hydroxyglutaryl-CoA dehydratase subunit BcrC/BadD/HgdB